MVRECRIYFFAELKENHYKLSKNKFTEMKASVKGKTESFGVTVCPLYDYQEKVKGDK